MTDFNERSANPRLVTTKELADICGVSLTAILNAAQKTLKDARRSYKPATFDLDHPAVIKYARRQGVELPLPTSAQTQQNAPVSVDFDAAPPPKRGRGRPKKSEALPDVGSDHEELQRVADALGEELHAVQHMTLQELLDKFHTQVGLKEWFDTAKKYEEIRMSQTKRARLSGELVERQYVKDHVLDLIERLTRQLLQDAPQTIARKLQAQARAGDPTEALADTVVDILSHSIVGVKQRVLRNLQPNRLKAAAEIAAVQETDDRKTNDS